jgi:hypothetical protein
MVLVVENHSKNTINNRLQEQLNALEAVLENIEGSLARTKEQLAESDSAVMSKFTSSAIF